MKKKLHNPYFLTLGLSSILFLLIFFIKGIFPFGENTLIYGDMYDQITAFYYHFYDIFYGNASFLVDFTTSGGVNFWGIFSYYIASPFTFLLLLFKRENLYLAVSIIVALKAILASLTCLYSVEHLSNKKCSPVLATTLALSYAFSGYFLSLYQITAWMDAMYLFPLLILGLKRVIDLEKPYLYIGILSLSMISSFYVTTMSLVLLFLIVCIYIRTEKTKQERKKSITSFVLATIFAIGISMFITLPSLAQIMASSRVQFSITNMLNAKVGPLLDKLSYFLPSSFLILAVLLLLKNRHRHKAFLKWYLPSMFILLVPYIIEPINKIIHFSSYAAFPNRYGYMTVYFLVLGSLVYCMKRPERNKKNRTLLNIGVWIVCMCAVGFLTLTNYEKIQTAITSLSISSVDRVFDILLITSIIISLSLGLILYRNQKNKAEIYILLLVLLQTSTNAYLYLGMDSSQQTYINTYQTMAELKKKHTPKDFYRLKNNTSSFITNNGMVTEYPNLDHFTSLVNRRNSHFLKQLGYSSHWTKTYSKNGSLFSDSILANQYYLTKQDVKNEWYQQLQTIGEYKLYSLKEELSYGYFTNPIEISENMHTFDVQNKIYQGITNQAENIFTIWKEFKTKNLEVLTKDQRTTYKIIDKDASNYLEMEIPVKEKSILYLEIFNSFQNTEDNSLYKKMKIYINHKLYKGSYPLRTNNGCLNLGIYEKENVLLQIELLEDISLSYIEVGSLSNQKLSSFIKKEKVASKVNFNRNRIEAEVTSQKSGLFFIPVSYSTGYKAFVNGEEQEVYPVYHNLLGVELKKGTNKIEFSYIPPGLKEGVWISVISMILCFGVYRWKLDKRLAQKKLGDICYKVCLGICGIILFMVYFVPLVCFILSYFFYIY